MKKKLIIGIVAGIVLLVLATIFAGYLFFAYLMWLFNDPFDLFLDNPQFVQTPFEKLPTYQECVKNGGIPIRSGWSGEVKRCDK